MERDVTRSISQATLAREEGKEAGRSVLIGRYSSGSVFVFAQKFHVATAISNKYICEKEEEDDSADLQVGEDESQCDSAKNTGTQGAFF